jgi:hypothetical protein
MLELVSLQNDIRFTCTGLERGKIRIVDDTRVRQFIHFLTVKPVIIGVGNNPLLQAVTTRTSGSGRMRSLIRPAVMTRPRASADLA